MVHFGIGDIGFDLDIPNPVDYANDMMAKAQNLLNSIKNAIFSFFNTAATKIGEGFRGLVNGLPKQIFSGIADVVKTLWKSFRGES